MISKTHFTYCRQIGFIYEKKDNLKDALFLYGIARYNVTHRIMYSLLAVQLTSSVLVGNKIGVHTHFQFASAIDRFNKAENDSSNCVIYWAIARVFGREARYDEALDAMSTALSIQMVTIFLNYIDVVSTHIEIRKLSEWLDGLSEA